VTTSRREFIKQILKGLFALALGSGRVMRTKEAEGLVNLVEFTASEPTKGICTNGLGALYSQNGQLTFERISTARKELERRSKCYGAWPLWTEEQSLNGGISFGGKILDVLPGPPDVVTAVEWDDCYTIWIRDTEGQIWLSEDGGITFHRTISPAFWRNDEN
jgi:hypothetical protein